MKSELFATVKTEGALLPAELLVRVASEDNDLPGLSSESYHLGKTERLSEAVTRSWNRLRGVWASFRPELDRLTEEDPGTGLTRDRWLNILFQELGFGRLSPARDLAIEGKNYPISHMWERVPIHLLGAGLSLDRRARGVVGAAVSSPHSLVQEFLNRSDDHLWAMVTNGKTLRILRDNLSLTRQAYLEFDLASMMEAELYSDFKLLWLLCHESRLEGERPEECWLEQWSRRAAKDGTRALDALRGGVEAAIEILGGGFLQHPSNTALRRALENGQLSRQDYYRQLLRLVYRLLFLFVAEDRSLLLDPSAPGELRERYLNYYSTARLRWLASRRRGTRHGDQWQALTVVMRHLGSDEGCPGLALYPLGGFLWSDQALSELSASQLSNHDLLEAVRKLSFTYEKNVPRPVDYKNMGTEELGSVYESLLELSPDLNQSAGSFTLIRQVGNERKSTGSYYTPHELVETLLESALEPVVTERLVEANRKGRINGLTGEALQNHMGEAVLSVTVCDPACGSGHFLIAAAHRLARRLASVRSGDAEPAPDQVRRALRDVIGHCIFGVDVNPMAVELCKVNLWIECLEPTKPLSFLENRILCGNSLLGTTDVRLKQGIPEEAFAAQAEDDKKFAALLKKRNAAERSGVIQQDLFDQVSRPLAHAARDIDKVSDSKIQGIHLKEELYAQWLANPDRLFERTALDAWCAAFVMRKDPNGPSITTETVTRLQREKQVHPELLQDIDDIRKSYQFFHWNLEFPDVFSTGGFDCVLANPPWGAAVADRVKPLLRTVLPSVKRGSIDTFAAFAQKSTELCKDSGWVGLVLPDILLLKNYPDLRLFLLELTSIHQIAHWGQAFPDASIDVCTISIKASKPSADHSINCVPEVVGGDLGNSPSNKIKQATFVSNKDYRFNLTLSTEKQELISSIRGLGPSVGELFTIREGVHSGNVRSKLFIERPEGELCRPLIFGRDEIKPMSLTWKGKHIQLDPARFDKENGEYYNIGDSTLFEQPKILVRRTGDFILAALDFEGRYCSNNFFIVVPKKAMSKESLIYTCATLNMPLATLYFRAIQPRTGKMFAELKITHLEDIPVPFFHEDFAATEGKNLIQDNYESSTQALLEFQNRFIEHVRVTSPLLARALEGENDKHRSDS